MADISVSVHELKARLSEYLGKSMHGQARIIIRRRDRPIAMIVPLSAAEDSRKCGLAGVDWSLFSDFSTILDDVHALRQSEAYREVSL
jgi:prevent-host-death family protein